jgi:hypothetical protein
MSDRRPADTVSPLANYLWWLLPGFLKRKAREQSVVGRLCDVWGEELETLRSTLEEILPLLVVETATGSWLDRLARGRQTFRREEESDESLRVRVLAAHEMKRQGGTLPGMVAGLAAVGYGIAVEEPYRGTPRWSHFVVRVLTWDGVVADQGVFYSLVRLLKPAHTRALVESELSPGRWDDWDEGDPPQELDSGTLDDWIATE